MMKKFRMGGLVMAAVVAATLMTGCQKDEVVLKAKFTPFAGDGKVYIDNTNTPRWEVGDLVSVNGVACTVSSSSTLSAAASAVYSAVYPSSIFDSWDGAAANVTLPRVQEYIVDVEDGHQVVKAPMCAYSTTNTLQFHNPGALLAIQTTKDDADMGSMVDFRGNLKIDSIQVISDKVSLWGAATIDDITATQPQLVTADAYSATKGVVSLTGESQTSLDADPGTTYYVSLPAVTGVNVNSHFTIRLYCHAGDTILYYSNTQTTTNAGDIPAGKLASVPSVIDVDFENVTYTPDPTPTSVTGVFHISATDSVCFAPGNLKKTSNGYEFMSNQYDYVSDVATNGVGSTYFSWSALSTHGFGTYSSPVSWSGLDGNWFVLTKAQWSYVMGLDAGRTGTTVNGNSGSLYVKASVDSVNGVILFPDNVTSITWPTGATAPTTSNINSSSADFTSATLTAAQWTSLENQGCVFLPAAGNCNGSSFGLQGTYGLYWSATQFSSSYAYYLYFYSSSLGMNYYSETIGLTVRLAKAYSN